MAVEHFAVMIHEWNKTNKDDPAKLKVDALLPQTMETLWMFCLDDFGLRLAE